MSAPLLRWLFLGLCVLVWRWNRKLGARTPLTLRSELFWIGSLFVIPVGIWTLWPHPVLSMASWVLTFAILLRTAWRLVMRLVDFAAVRSRPADVPSAKGRLLTTRALQVRSYSFDDAPAPLQGLSVVLLSDLHCDGWPEPAWYDRYWQVVKGLQPDLILIAGDFLSRPESLPLVRRCLHDLGRLRPPMGIHAILGNRDEACAAELIALLQTLSVNVLQDETRTLIHPSGRSIRLAGTSWPWCGSEALRKCMEDGAVDIALTHTPENARELASAGAGWILAGHTHGGQIALPLLGGVISPNGGKYIYGHHVIGHSHLVVTSGVGCSWLPVRCLVHPEIVLLRF
ncbi:MAG: hypothetical protein RL318_2074 [Fibrobacterota bacterium]|jgi:predicted MPP superfamily phosphohydrolase